MAIHRPLATYRLQLNKDFGFRQAEAVAPYLHQLGISHIYASPILAARAGSSHGYDVIDPSKLDPELGTDEDFQSLLAALRGLGLGLVLDIVPNHMAADVSNPWWRDVLVHGHASVYASYFDIDWEGGGGKLVLPLLGRPLDAALRDRELQVKEEGGVYFVAYFEKRWPLAPASVELARQAASRDEEALSALLDAQHYRFAQFEEPPNYRRFFDINDLVSVRVEDEAVFNATHELVVRLVIQDGVAGLRVDHIDGLRDPAGYLRRLRSAVGDSAYLVVEKILGENESVPSSWPVQGTTGYDFLAVINGMFASEEGVEALGRAYDRFTGVRHDFDHEVRSQKRRVLDMLFSHEVASLSKQMEDILLRDLGIAHISGETLSQVLKDLTAQIPVYRTYADASGMPPEGVRLVTEVFARLRQEAVDERQEAVDFLQQVLTLAYPDGLSAERREAWMAAVTRWQQLSGPATAKGLEDTAFYRYNRLISLNEVGAHARPYQLDHVHEFLKNRASAWPYAMNASSTHDTKRSEDLRARIHVLSWIAEEWIETLTRWSDWNAPLKRDLDGEAMPDVNMEWLLYQTLVGVWPLSADQEAGILPRLQRFLTKAAREAKERTSWRSVNEQYEEALLGFAEAVLDPKGSKEFLQDLRRVVARIAPLGAVVSLAQLAIKFTAPGLPDVYQGQELWDLSLTDPDNRRPVDYALREGLLKVLSQAALSEMTEHWDDGRMKLYATNKLFELRKQRRELFQAGEYLRMDDGRRHTFAFARQRGSDWLIVVVPRFVASVPEDGKLPLGHGLGQGTTLRLPGEAPGEWRDIFTGETVVTPEGVIHADAVLEGFPVSVLTSRWK